MSVTPEAMRTALEKGRAACLAASGGKNADYIPYLASVPSGLFGIAVVTADGQVFKTGDADFAFAIESIQRRSREDWCQSADGRAGSDECLDCHRARHRLHGRRGHLCPAWTRHSPGRPGCFAQLPDRRRDCAACRLFLRPALGSLSRSRKADRLSFEAFPKGLFAGILSLVYLVTLIVTVAVVARASAPMPHSSSSVMLPATERRMPSSWCSPSP
jgi:Glutaminase